MIAKAIEKIKEMHEQSMELLEFEIGGKKFIQSRGELFNDKPSIADTITLSSLSSLVQYVKSDLDGKTNKRIIRIVSPTNILLHGETFSAYNVRQISAEVKPLLPDPFKFSQFMDGESFIIGLQAQFVQNIGDWADVVSACAGIKRDEGMSYKDDGISQSVAAKKGISLTTTKPLPNPVKLAPYRTFLEIEQPVSSFVLRVTDRRGEPELALFEADGGAWKLDAMQKIKIWLQKELNNDVLILA